MKRSLLALFVLMVLGLTACNKNEEPKQEAASDNSAHQIVAGQHKVEVIECIDASNYSYLHVSENGKDYWMAVPQMKVEKGQTLYYSQSMEMKDFHSKALDKTFDSILFVQDVSSQNPGAQVQASGQPMGTPSVAKENVSISPLKDGKTVADIYTDKSDLKGKSVKIRGKVVKYNPAIMSRNWIHIQDGTGSGNDYDLMVTSTDEAEVGQIVVVEGTVEVNKDFGYGYYYPVLLENASVKVQKNM